MFDKPTTLRKLWTKVARSYAADALEDAKEESAPLEPEGITAWLRSASSAEQHWFNSPGLGQDVRIEGDRLVGATLVVDDQPVHLELFRENPEPARSQPAEPRQPSPNPKPSGGSGKFSAFMRKLFSTES